MNKYRPSEEELKIINEKFAKENFKSVDDLYLFPAMIIDNQMTAYFTRVHPDFLNQCVKDLANGVPFLVGHDKTNLPMARSLKGQLTSNGDLMEVYAKFFMQKNLNVNGVNTDDFFKSYLGGTTIDVSIGFAAKRWECSICANDIRDGAKCKHFPGRRYNDKDEEVEKDGTQCFAWVKEPAGPSGEALLEVSSVYRGAAPNAKTKKPAETPAFTVNIDSTKSIKEVALDVPIAMNFSFPLGNKEEFSCDKLISGQYKEEELKVFKLSPENIDSILKVELTEEEAKTLKGLAEKNKVDLGEYLKKFPAIELLHAETEYARWTREYINSLPDASFAVVEGDKIKARHLPHQNEKGGDTLNQNLDLPRLKNALARVNQIKPVTDSISEEDLRSKAAAHLEHHKGALESEKQAQEITDLKAQLETAKTNNTASLDKISSLEKEKTDLSKKAESLEAANLQLQKDNQALEPKAKEGDQYRKDLVKEILELGVKLNGNAFDSASYEKTLKDMALEDIKKMKAQFWTQLCEKLPAVKHTLGPKGSLSDSKQEDVPDKAFKVS